MATLILFPWLFLGQRWKTNNSLKTPLPISFTAKSLTMQRMTNRVKVGGPIPKSIMSVSLRSLIKMSSELECGREDKNWKNQSSHTDLAQD